TDTTVRGVHQPMRVAGLAWGDAEAARWESRPARADFFEIKGDLEALLSPLKPSFERVEHPALHPGRAATVLLDGQAVGVIGELHPRWRQQWELSQAPVLFELALDVVTGRPVPLAKPVPRHQAVERDLALVVPESVGFSSLVTAIQAAATHGLLRDVQLFDIYRPAAGASAGGLNTGEKSMAVRLLLQSDAGSLTDEQVDAVVQAVVAQCASQVGARLRA
ncbi:MAG: phenylalanine--tRNA ligase subunit beta, partial [Comamonadaceae bacterium]